jgi:transposase
MAKPLSDDLRSRVVDAVEDGMSRRAAAVRAAIEQAGARLRLLPPYSPDLNPIENAFAKLKALLRKAAARTSETLLSATLCRPSADECANYLTAAGYAPT